MWFEKLVGFKEKDDLYNNLSYENELIHSKVNNKSYKTGTLTITRLKDLKEIYIKETNSNTIKYRLSDIKNILENPNSKNAVFQVASQFNLLEMIRPETTPENGIDIYEYDMTQGPICSIAAGAGTIYRNYFIDIKGHRGQNKDIQIDCLADIGDYLDNSSNRLWTMKNGYALLNAEGLSQVIEEIKTDKENIKDLLRVGIQKNVQVTSNDCTHCITQVFCSALPLSYLRIDKALTRDLAKLILEGTYEATFIAAIENKEKTGCSKLYLTLVGGGAFGNDISWILDSISYCYNKYKDFGLDIELINYDYSYRVEEFVNELSV